MSDRTIDAEATDLSGEEIERSGPWESSGKEWLFRLVFAGLGMTSVLPLLAWVYDLGPFHIWFWATTVPGGTIMLATSLWGRVRHRGGEIHQIARVAVIAGLIGTVGYDVFRIPFVTVGFRLLSPIESCGVLLVNGDTSSGISDFAGWT